MIIVDDESLVRAALRVFLDSADGFDLVGEADNGIDAIALVRSTHPDVVLMDVQMPGMDGLAATRAIGRLTPKHTLPPVIGMTANAFPSDVENCMAAGMAAHVAKPFDFGELLRMVTTVAKRGNAEAGASAVARS